MLDQGRAALYPIAIVAIKHTIDGANFCAVNMTAHHALVATFFRLMGHSVFKVGDEVQCLLHFAFQIGRQGPIRQTHMAAQTVEMPVQAQGQFIQGVAQVGQPFGVFDDRIEIVAMHQPQFTPIQRGV